MRRLAAPSSLGAFQGRIRSQEIDRRPQIASWKPKSGWIEGSRSHLEGARKRLEPTIRLPEGSIPLLPATRRRLAVVISRLTVAIHVRTCALSLVAPSKKPHPNAVRLAKPAVRRKMVEVIGKQVSKSDADDVVQATFLVLLKMVAELPEAETELLALVTVVTKRRLIDFFRHRAVRQGRDAGIEDIEEAPVSDGSISLEARADWAKMLDLVEEEIEKGNIPPEVLRWARGLAEGKTIAEMAAEEDVSESKIKMALKRAREKLEPLWEQKLKVGATLIVVFILCLFIPRERPEHHGRGHDRDMGAPKMPTLPEPATPDAEAPTFDAGLVTADDLRGTARIACNAHEFAVCQMDLNRAAQLDPDSEKRPDVIAMRRAIAKAILPQRLKP